PAPEGVNVRIAARTEVIPREGMAWPTLIVQAPRVRGPFRGALVISSPDVPDWSVRYTFDGEVSREALEGR
ncbi:hypothetical protein WFJ45_24345, partial [Salmonella enterica subsp. enterica serovar Minnesota]|uniref:hypothetical protein n=1 Tax=Salmonella enterica TaxID=28901 RepID=UPI003D2C307F